MAFSPSAESSQLPQAATARAGWRWGSGPSFGGGQFTPLITTLLANYLWIPYKSPKRCGCPLVTSETHFPSTYSGGWGGNTAQTA